MSNYKYPFVPREYYPAVIFACKMIREKGFFNKAIRTAANYYDVDEDVLIKHVRARQGAGQKGKTGRKYYWFAVEYMFGTCERVTCFVPDWAEFKVIKATSKENVKCRKEFESILRDSELASSICYFGRIEKFGTENEAKRQVSKWKLENRGA